MRTKTYRPEPAYDLARTAYGELGLSTEDLMRPSTYCRARGLSRWPIRLTCGRPRPVVTRDGIGVEQPKSSAAKRAQEAYALRAELGHRAYAELTGTRAKRTTVARKRPSPKVEAVESVRTKAHAAGASAVVLSDGELLKALGIKPIVMGEMD